jgi:hypothetical protein
MMRKAFHTSNGAANGLAPFMGGTRLVHGPCDRRPATARYHRPGGWDFGVFILVAVKEGDQDQTG